MTFRHSFDLLKSVFVFVCLVLMSCGREEQISDYRSLLLPNNQLRRNRFSYYSEHKLEPLGSREKLRHTDNLSAFAMLLSGLTPLHSRPMAFRGGASTARQTQTHSPNPCTDSGMERTYIMIKPDGVQRSLVGEIIKRFEQRGYQLKAIKMHQASEDLLREHYKEHINRDFFPGLLEYMLSGPVICMVWEGENVVKMARQMLGATNPQQSVPGTIRGDFSIETQRNICHGSDSPESAEHEISLWFSEDELCDWASHSSSWIYK